MTPSRYGKKTTAKATVGETLQIAHNSALAVRQTAKFAAWLAVIALVVSIVSCVDRITAPKCQPVQTSRGDTITVCWGKR